MSPRTFAQWVTLLVATFAGLVWVVGIVTGGVW